MKGNEMTLEVGKKYTILNWNQDCFVKVLDIGRGDVWVETQDGRKMSFLRADKWLPYEEPALDDTRLWYWESYDESLKSLPII